MLYYIRKYPLSLLIILAVIYLSFFKPPTMDMPKFPGLDKLAHFCMYGGLSGMLWFEFIWNHRKEAYIPFLRGFIGASLCPVLFSGIIELLQEYITTYRGGEWLDFLANTCGVLIATLFTWYVLRPFIKKRFATSKIN